MPDSGGARKVAMTVVVQRQDLPRLLQQVAAVRGQFRRASLAAMQQGLAEQLLQALHLHGNGGLGAADQGGGVGEAAALGDQHEAAQQVGVKGGGSVMGINMADAGNQINSFY